MQKEAEMLQESWPKVLAKVGAVGAIALYLVWLLGGEVKSSVARTEALMSQHAGDTVYMRDALKVLVNVNLQNCVNQAGANSARQQACFDALYMAPDPRGQR